ncbi:3-isopropylmalate dehydratase large subunit [Carboxydochorda subterranea]|uniref:3-isopropylmalate dehydratase large subunit n=1 Tax=Carboxydichorda subterranea TaxID=3109565 RepID=A0ABZ1BUA9_9FIRM|nr:3-isopropylmalate dehydratase large subunit [Limnochorda sp. L945t]WRP16405.1 3-isopropylmalate dehydratase large subunit [Limnochorda sp. L945t]
MAMTLVEKLLADHSGRREVRAGEIVHARVDMILANDVTAPISIQEFYRMGARRVFNREAVAMVPSHFAPSPTIQAAANIQAMRQFAREQDLPYFFEIGRMGIEHVLLPEEGLVVPGDVVIGADSHTCTNGALGCFATGMGSTDIAAAMALGETWLRVPETLRVVYYGRRKPWVTAKDLVLHTIGRIGVAGALYQALEYTGEAVRDISMEGRFTMANMAIEAGAKTGIFEVDEVTLAWEEGRARRPPRIFRGDPGARYAGEVEIDVSRVEPQVAFPHLPENTRPVSEAAALGVRIDQAFVGSCTNGRIEDLRLAARVLRGRRVHQDVRMIVIPASQRVYRQAMAEGLLDCFVEAGAAVSTPTCGPCLGAHMGVLARGERAISTSNRNFVGRMGHRESEIYLASPAVVAASAVMGRIASPEELGLTEKDFLEVAGEAA